LRVGCPIRRSRDQRLLASPPGLSQRATPFIASQCQGIHQMPFLRSFPGVTSATPDKTRHSQGQKPLPPITDPRTTTIAPGVTLYSREDTLPQRQVNILPAPTALIPSNLIEIAEGPAADAKRTRHPPRSHSLHPVKEHCLQPKPATIWYFHDRVKTPSHDATVPLSR
jgi:hypothetical protein